MFVISYGEADDYYLSITSTDDAFDEAETANVRATGGDQIAERSIEVAGVHGREQRISSGRRICFGWYSLALGCTRSRPVGGQISCR